MTAPAVPCRRAEAALLAGGLPVAPEVASHASFCATCGPVLADCEANDALLAALAIPSPPGTLAAALHGLAKTEPARVAAREVMALLAPEALAAPEPSPALLRRLLVLPAGHPRRTGGNVVEMSRFRRLRGDWRVLVAAAYAACLILVAVLGVDPLSAARSGAGGVAAAGERAIAEAREAASEKLGTVLTSQRRKPLTEQLDYRVYRTLAVGRAKTTAWAEILLGRLFGSREETREPARPPLREPATPDLRSLDRAGQDSPLEKAQRA